MRIFTYIFAILVALLGISFACLNADKVSINYYVGTSQIPLSILVALTFAIGAVFGLIGCAAIFLRLKREQYKLQKRVKIAEKEIENLRAIPVKDSH